MNSRASVKPRRIDQEDDRGDHNLREPADDEEQRREHDPPEAELRQPEGGPEVEHVPGQPEDEWPEEENHGERRESNRDPARYERTDPEDAEDDAEDRAHEPSIRPAEGRAEAGDPIPDAKLRIVHSKGKPLSRLAPGERATVQKVPDRDAELLRYLTSLDLLPGQPVELVRAEPLGGPLTIRAKGRETAISRQLGDQIHVLS